ncbi:MAG: TAT-variant-translocated molybdopterin oxidoreductase [Chitinophagaceae bacterium]
MSNKNNQKHWQSFGEFTKSPEVVKQSENELPEILPLSKTESFFGKTSRRDFLKMMGFSTTAAIVASSCETPIHKAIPFLNQPVQNNTPGIADFFATTYVSQGEAYSVIAKVREGRPIKIEPNTLAPLSLGKTSASAQASVLDLYDTYRLAYPTKKGKEVSFEKIDEEILTSLQNTKGSIVLLTAPITSITGIEVINQFKAKFKNVKHQTYNPISYNGLLKANKESYGISQLANYNFDKAKVIVSFGADFLGSWITPTRFSAQYVKNRKLKEGQMSKHIQFESYMSISGANADERFVHRPSQLSQIVFALYNALKGLPINIKEKKLKQAIEHAAGQLLENKGQSLVVCGSNNRDIQNTINVINSFLRNVGNTIDLTNPIVSFDANDEEFELLIDQMNTGQVGAIIIQGVNPMYTYPKSKVLKQAFSKVPLKISLNNKNDETTQLCDVVVPDLNYLESWGDVQPIKGTVLFIQPMIVPLFKNRSWLESLLVWSSNQTLYSDFFKKFWIERLTGEIAYKKALQKGFVIEKPLSTPLNIACRALVTSPIVLSKFDFPYEIVFYQNVAIRNGEQASNPWLQEMPDPITKATWDNYAMVSYAFAKNVLGIDLKQPKDADYYEVYPEKPMINIKITGKNFDIPVLVIPGMEDNTIAIALGYGRTPEIGEAVKKNGVNVFPYIPIKEGDIQYYQTNVSVEKIDKKYIIAQTQTHLTAEDRSSIVQESTLQEYQKEPEIFQELHKELTEEFAQKGGSYRKEATLYKGHAEKSGIHWGMSIDMNACIGCGACTISCMAENNVPIVGKEEVSKYHDMHWLRIDRYFGGDVENPHVVFQPMMCQHCNNAPCENVCPVSATNHSNEGLNQMAYNRCVGTRYCANNCPYKVRRFNWRNYTGADYFNDNQKGIVDDVVLMMNDDLTRMVLNPDVTVRSRGVIEKCSMCTQRLQAGKLKAKSENRELVDADVPTACMQACPTEAISFGNVLNKESDVVKQRSDKRSYYLLEQIHVLPNVNYLAKVRNTDLEASKHEAQK